MASGGLIGHDLTHYARLAVTVDAGPDRQLAGTQLDDVVRLVPRQQHAFVDARVLGPDIVREHRRIAQFVRVLGTRIAHRNEHRLDADSLDQAFVRILFRQHHDLYAVTAQSFA